MAFAVDYAVCDDPLDEELQCAERPTADLFAKIIDGVCRRIHGSRTAGKTIKIYCFIESGAWIDAALTLIELELPAWQLRRLARDGSEWFCSLSRQPHLDASLDDTADGSHELMALAILRAFLQARRLADSGKRAATVPPIGPDAGVPICCDNFA